MGGDFDDPSRFMRNVFWIRNFCSLRIGKKRYPTGVGELLSNFVVERCDLAHRGYANCAKICIDILAINSSDDVVEINFNKRLVYSGERRLFGFHIHHRLDNSIPYDKFISFEV